MKLALEDRLGMSIDAEANVMTFMAEYAGYLVNRLVVGKDGKTAYQRWKGKEFKREVAEFGETVMYLKAGSQGVPGAVRVYKELSGCARSFQGVSGAIRACQELLGRSRTYQGVPGAVRACQELSGRARNYQGVPGAVRKCQELSGRAKFIFCMSEIAVVFQSLKPS